MVFDKTQPLWLPAGSVRSILALALVIVTCYLAIDAKIAPDAFLPIVVAVVAFYFGTKSGSSMPEQAETPNREPAG